MTLIKTIEIVQEHVVFDTDMTLTVLNPHISFAERYVKKIIGVGQFLALQAAVELDNATQEQEALLAVIYPALSKLGVAGWTEMGVLSLSKSGMRRIEDANEKSAYKYQEDSLRLGLIKQGFTELDDIVSFLEENEADYPLWVNDSYAYTRFKQFFINTTEEFQNEYGINNSPTTFRAFYPLLKSVDWMIVGKVLGNDLYEEIKAQIAAKAVTTENEFLLREYIRPAVAHYVIADAIAMLAVEVSDGGVRVTEMMQTYPSNVIQKTANRDLKDPLLEKVKTKAGSYLNDLMVELKTKASATKYATYFAEKGSVASTNGNTDTTRKIWRA